MATACGGPSTVNGVLYQMLWTLLNAVEIKIASSDTDPHAVTAESAFLIVEPQGGGGDLVHIEPSGRHIQQIKARTDGSTWSLAEIVAEVLPDLYKAVDSSRSDDVYDFITEGRRGDWEKVETFFASIKKRTQFSLDGAEVLPFRHYTHGSTSFFSDATYTEQSLFDKIVSHLKGSGETLEEAQQKVWHLLSHFTFRGDQKPEIWRDRIDRFLLEVIDFAENVVEKRLALIAKLAEKATVADTIVRPSDLFTECGLNAARLSGWQTYVNQGAQLLHREASLRGYQYLDDVRPVEAWAPSTPIVLITGESGQGKTWQSFSLAHYLAQTSVVVLIEATGNSNADLQRAGAAFWQDIGGHDQPLALRQISARMHQMPALPAGRCLYLFVDKLHSLEEAHYLAALDWESYGICLIAMTPLLIAEEMEKWAPGRVTVLPVRDFTRDEMARYLVGSNLLRWQTIPADVRDTLRRPLLARLYREISSEAEYIPTNEYELYNRWWSDLRRGREITATRLSHLALTVLRGSPYPWTSEQLIYAGLDQDANDELLRHGGLQRTANGRFMIWHDRVLNWAVAEALVGATVSGNLSQEELCAEACGLFSPAAGANIIFSYVPMDIVWILVTRHPDRTDLLDALLDALAASDWRAHQVLFQDLLPTVGPRVTDAIMRYVLRHSGSNYDFGTNEIIKGLTHFSAEDLATGTRTLLDQTEPETIRVATGILAAKPHPDNLNALWQLFCDLGNHSERYAGESVPEQIGNSDQTWWLERSCSRALRACVQLDPEWLEHQILQTDPSLVPLHDLAFLLSGLSDGRKNWQRCKSILIRTLPPEKSRAIALNIFTHCDESEKEWVQSRVSSTEDSLGEYALRALTRLDFQAAVEALPNLPGQALYLTRSWCLRGLLLRDPEATGIKLWERRDNDPVNLARAFQGQADYLPPNLLDWLLDQTEILLDQAETFEAAHLLLDLLAEINQLESLKLFEKRQGTLLEKRLTSLLAQNPRPYLSQETATREPALAVLYKIGGGGLTQVINAWLSAASAYGKYDAFAMAFKRPDAGTVQILEEMATGSALAEGEDNHNHLAYMATEALIGIGAWPSVIHAATVLGMNEIPRSASVATNGRVCLLNAAMSSAITAFEANAGRHPGALIALGIGGRSDYLERILAVLSHEEPDSDVAHACTVALSVLDDPSGLATEALIRRLSMNQSQYAANLGLRQNPNSKALAALADILATRFDVSLAIFLVNYPETREAALRAMRNALKQGGLGAEGLIRSLQRDNKEEINLLFNTSELQSTISEQAFAPEGGLWHVGSKASIISALSIFDSEAAFEAASHALRSPESHDRQLYPYLLVEINPESAAEVLFEMMCHEDASAMQAAVGHALAQVSNQIRPMIFDWLESDQWRHRLSACHLAAYQPPSADLWDAIRLRLDDEHRSVMEAAETAIWQMQKSRWSQEIIEAFVAETFPERRWRLLDAALEVGDLGDVNRPWPDWLVKLAESLPHFWTNYIEESVKRRREKLLKDTEYTDRRRKE